MNLSMPLATNQCTVIQDVLLFTLITCGKIFQTHDKLPNEERHRDLVFLKIQRKSHRFPVLSFGVFQQVILRFAP